MDPELAELASAAATTVVTLLVTDGWEKAKSAMGSLWRSVRPDRAGRAEADIVDAREDLLRAGPDGANVKSELIGQWASRLRALLAADPALAPVLRRLLDDELRPALPVGVSRQIGSITMEAHADHGGRIYQSGQGDINTNENRP
jgi:hypothetical protein